MFDVGFWELTLIGVVALVIIGPERLPAAARTAGLWVGKARNMLREVKADISRELREQEIADLDALKKDMQNAGDELNESLQGAGEKIKQSTQAVKTPFEDLQKNVSTAQDGGGAATQAHDEKNKSYWIYANQIKQTTKLHRATCPHCRHGQGQNKSGKRPPRERDQWHGPLALQDAEQKQKAIGFKSSSACKICM